ncbi:hypothetical protein L3X38_007394 [Prunus dulcis]|uniref:EF-hand domain-containing protein n=1 Tax=Prunus dulcis TaxID=3755 RepID=A0AAD5F608_PRUDU|nr:hypothetical protein L3X38_007394 [Prunus dulcis]
MVFDTNHKVPNNVPYTEEQIMNVFKSHDKNGDAQLSKEELKEAFKELGSKYPPLRAWFAKNYADDNRDGFISIDKELSKLVKVEETKEVTFRYLSFPGKMNLNPDYV